MYLIIMCTNVFTIKREIPICYIEMTSWPYKERLQYHYALSQLEEPKDHIHKAIKALGSQFFKWEILESCETEKEAHELLKYYQTEYHSNTIGYNAPLDESFTGENNPMYGNFGTFEEKYGKEKADEIKQKQSVSQLGRPSPHTTERNLIHNPMNDPKTREKCSEKKMGTKNPKAIYDYILTRDDGSEIIIECVDEYCREHKDVSKIGLLKAIREKRKYKGMSVKKIYKNKGV